MQSCSICALFVPANEMGTHLQIHSKHVVEYVSKDETTRVMYNAILAELSRVKKQYESYIRHSKYTANYLSCNALYRPMNGSNQYISYLYCDTIPATYFKIFRACTLLSSYSEYESQRIEMGNSYVLAYRICTIPEYGKLLSTREILLMLHSYCNIYQDRIYPKGSVFALFDKVCSM
jgi:hypothetical protein